jgi:hypothetical protein
MLKPVAFIAGMMLASIAYAQSSLTPNQFYGGMMQHQQQQLETPRYKQDLDTHRYQQIPQYNAPVRNEYTQPRGIPCGGFTGIAC